MANKMIITKLLRELEDYLVKIEKYKDVPENEFKDDWEMYWHVDHGLHLAIQACIDIAKEIITIKKLVKPRKYREIFIILRRNAIVSHALADEMQKLAEFRNRLIHEYLYMDPKEIYRVYKNKRKYLHCFAKEVVKWLKSQKDD